jgi:hypothetical protein
MIAAGINQRSKLAQFSRCYTRIGCTVKLHFTHSFGGFTCRPQPDAQLLVPMRYVVQKSTLLKFTLAI